MKKRVWWKKGLSGLISGCMLLSALQIGTVIPASAAVVTPEEQMKTFKTAADIDGNYSVSIVNDSYQEGEGESTSTAVQSWYQDTSRKVGIMGDGTSWRIDFDKGNRRAVTARYDVGYPKVVHSFTPGSKTILETKFFYEKDSHIVELFLPGTDGGGAWGSSKSLITIKAQNESNRTWLVQDVNGGELLSLDDPRYQTNGERDTAKIQADWINQWHHIYIELESLENNQIQYDVYHNGEKLNDAPIVFTVDTSAVEKNATGINRWINRINAWGSGYILLDDLGVQPVQELTLRNSTVIDGQIGADTKGPIVLDFNTLLDQNTLDSITLKTADDQVPEGLSKHFDGTDHSRVVLEWSGNLQEKTQYIIDYSKLTDIHNSIADGTITFTSGQKPTTETVTPFVEKRFDSQSDALNGTVEDGVLHMTLEGSGASMSNDLDFSEEIHDFDDSASATIMEYKLKAKSTGNVRAFFSGSDTNGQWWADVLSTDQGGFTHLLPNTNNNSVKDTNYAANQWYHIFIVSRGNTFDYYVDGMKMNESPIMFLATNQLRPVVDSGISGIKKLRYTFRVWGQDETWLDDMIVQKMAALQLQSSSLDSSINEVALNGQTVLLDFNTLLDEESLEQIKLYEGEIEKTGITVEIDDEDRTRAKVTIPDGTLDPESEYDIRYTGVKDIFGTAADGALHFKTAVRLTDANIKKAEPASGSMIELTEFAPVFEFDQRMDPATMTAENITLTAADAQAPASVSLAEAKMSNSNKTVQLRFQGNLLAGKEYTLTFGEGVKTEDGNYTVAQDSRSYTFKTVANVNSLINEFESLQAGRGGVYKLEGSFKLDTSSPETFDGDTSRVMLDTSYESSIIFDLGGSGDYSFDFFDISYNSNGKSTIYVSESADGIQFTEPIRMVVYPEANEFTNTATEVVPQRDASFVPGAGVTDLWTYSGVLQEGNRYLKITMKKTNPDSSWTPRLRNITLNYKTPGESSGMVSSSPTNGETAVNRGRMIQMNYDTPLYYGSVNANSFTVKANGVPIENVDVELRSDCKQVTLNLPIRMTGETVYTVEPNQVYDVYDNLVTQGLQFTTEPASVTLVKTALLDTEGNETSFGVGTLKPQFNLNNETTETQQVFLATAVYDGDVLEKIAVCKPQVAPGEQTVQFEETLSVTDAEGKTLKFLAWNDLAEMIPLPKATFGEVDNTYYPGFVRKAITLSYDDGPQYSDKTMIDYMNQYGVRGTFNLNATKFNGMSTTDIDSYVELYSHQEAANHTDTHPRLNEISLEEAQADILAGKQKIEDKLGTEVRGFAYPYSRAAGSLTELDIVEYLKETGHMYGRNSSTNGGSFAIPEDFQNWKFTCHHTDNNFEALQDQFYNLPDDGQLYLFSVWGHSWEFDQDVSAGRPEETWSTILVPFLQGVQAHKDEIWNPTNIEFYDYLQAQKTLEITEEYIYNPSNTDVYVKIDGQETVVPAGQWIYPE